MVVCTQKMVVYPQKMKHFGIYHIFFGCPKWHPVIKGSLGGETSVLRTFGMSGKEFVKERVSEGKS